MRAWCRLMVTVLFRYRCHGRERIPTSGTVLVLSNHQSYLDPVLIGVAVNRQLNFLARETLFQWTPFSWLLSSVGTIPINREGLGLSGMKETLRRLKRGEMMVLFPEGTRTSDGEVGPLLPGFCTLAVRSKATLLPMAIDGAFDVWPRCRWLPWPSVIHVQIGPPISPEEVAGCDEAELVERVAERIGACHAEARRRRQCKARRK